MEQCFVAWHPRWICWFWHVPSREWWVQSPIICGPANYAIREEEACRLVRRRERYRFICLIFVSFSLQHISHRLDTTVSLISKNNTLPLLHITQKATGTLPRFIEHVCGFEFILYIHLLTRINHSLFGLGAGLGGPLGGWINDTFGWYVTEWVTSPSLWIRRLEHRRWAFLFQVRGMQDTDSTVTWYLITGS